MKSALRIFPFLVLAASISSACPVCDTPTGQQVRAGLFNENFGSHLLLTLAPFPILALLVLALHFGVRSRAANGSVKGSVDGSVNGSRTNRDGAGLQEAK